MSQIAGDIINVIALGSASARPDAETFSFIQMAPTVLIALDDDDAGTQNSFNGWLANLPNGHHLLQPKNPVGGRFKDPTEAWQGGIDLREWVEYWLWMASRQLAAQDLPDKEKGNSLLYSDAIGEVPKAEPDEPGNDPSPSPTSAAADLGTTNTEGQIKEEDITLPEIKSSLGAEVVSSVPGHGVNRPAKLLRMTEADWLRYEKLKDKRYQNLPNDLRAKMYLSPGEQGYTPAWPWNQWTAKWDRPGPGTVGQPGGFTETPESESD
ncbi:MAG: hypothetical protein HQK59_17765 [Deltaproteobacteria bacterium]|nr:hypothetical protein [Deltaproteobacteria bacterium]